jgi:ATP-dependent Clp protease ATP-binding subunit ClpB
MANNIFAGLNETMSKIVANTLATGFTPANLFVNMLSEKNIVSEYFRLNANLNKVISDFRSLQSEQESNPGFEKLLEKQLMRAKKSGADRYLDEIKFMNLIISNHKLSKVFFNVVSKYLDIDYIIEDFANLANPAPIMQWDKNESTILDTIGQDLTAKALSGDMHTIVGREEELMRVIQILTRQTKANPILVGEAGVGKTAIAEKLASILTTPENVPSSLHGYKLYEVSIAAIMSADKPEDVVAEMLAIIENTKIIIFMDEVHMMMEQQAKLANLLKPAMARGTLKLVGATTEDEYKVFEHDKAMVRRFQPVKIDEPNKIATYTILKQKAIEAEEVHDVLIPQESLLKAIQLSDRYQPNRQFPDKAIDLVEEASAKLRMILEAKPEPLVEVSKKIGDIEVELEMTKVQYRGKNVNHRTQKKVDDMTEKLQEYKLEHDRIEAEYKKQLVLIHDVINTKTEIKEAMAAYEEAMHTGEFAEAVVFDTQKLPELRKKLEQAEEILLDFAKNTDENLIQNVVVPAMISKVIEDQTGIPVSSQDEEDILKYKNMFDEVTQRVRGQERALAAITSAIQRSKAGLSNPAKPIGSFLCLGPTGVGKTETAKTIAEFMFDTEDVLHRFDMSEYMESHSVSRLFGSPPGYVGHDAGGQLTEVVKRNPYSILLFDEIEKAHPRVFDALLQVLDNGRMTDGKGETVNFKNTVIIMTSNLGSNIIKYGFENGDPVELIEAALLDDIKKDFRPEFLNRFDAKVMFNALPPKVIVGIANNELQKLSDRLVRDNELELFWHPDVPVAITNQAYDVNDGARPIQRFIDTEIVAKITEGILDLSITKGDTLFLSTEDDEMILFPVEPEELAAIQASISPEAHLDETLVEQTSTNPKVNPDDIVDAIMDDAPSKKEIKARKAAKKAAKKAKKHNATEKPLSTEVGDQ